LKEVFFLQTEARVSRGARPREGEILREATSDNKLTGLLMASWAALTQAVLWPLISNLGQLGRETGGERERERERERVNSVEFC
jgi:hypothetical protein